MLSSGLEEIWAEANDIEAAAVSLYVAGSAFSQRDKAVGEAESKLQQLHYY